MEYKFKIFNVERIYIGFQQLSTVGKDNYVETIETVNMYKKKIVKFSDKGLLRSFTNYNGEVFEENRDYQFSSYINRKNSEKIYYKMGLYCFESFLLYPEALWRGNDKKNICYLIEENSMMITECRYFCRKSGVNKIIIINYPINIKLIYNEFWNLIKYEDCINKLYYENNIW